MADGIDIEETTPLKLKKDRINSIDIFKGIAIFWIIGGHITWYWLKPDSLWMNVVLLDFIFRAITSAAFVMLSGMNLAISVSNKKDKGWSDKQIRSYTLRRLGVLFLLSILYNFMSGIFTETNQWYQLYAWFVLQTISVSLILLIFMLNVSRTLKVILGLTIFIISYPIHYLLNYLGSGWLFVDYLLYFPFDKFPLLPWSGLAFIGYVVGEIFYDATYKSKPEQKKMKIRKLMRALVLIGAAFLALGIATGFRIPTTHPYEIEWLNMIQYEIDALNVNPFFSFAGLPFFLIYSSFQFMLYSLGVDFLLLALLTYLYDYKKGKNFISKGFVFAGKFAFSIFFYHHIGIAFPFLYETFNYITIWPVWISFAIFIIFITWILVKKFQGVGTVEWLIGLATYKHRLKIEEELKNIKN